MSRFRIQVAVRSPFLFAGLEAAAVGVDSSALRDDAGRAIIPGDHVRGHLNHAFRTLNAHAPGAVPEALVRTLFGKKSDDAGRDPKGDQGNYEPTERGAIAISDLTAETMHTNGATSSTLPARGRELYTRVAIDDESGAADDGSLQTVELVAGLDAVVVFRGSVDIAPHKGIPADIDRLIRNALRLVPAMGAVKSSGFGELVHELCCINALAPATSTAVVIPSGDRFDLTVAFDRPIMVDADRRSANYFEGATIVPGGAIKGALAEAFRQSSNPGIANKGDPLGEALSRVRIGHAFPLVGDELGDRAIPNCLVSIPLGNRVHRVVDLNDAAARWFDWADGTPAFPLDWKRNVFQEVRKGLRRPDTERHLTRLPRGRVMIKDEGVAEGGALFVTAPVGTSGRRWRFTIERNGAEAAEFRKLLDRLKEGIGGLGRTGARITLVSAKPNQAPAAQVMTIGGERAVVLLLETPAVLTDPDDGASPQEQYEATLRALSGIPDLTLLSHFAQRKLAGGYLALRYRPFGRTPDGTLRYQPFELTEKGAVFVLKADDAGKVQTFAQRAARTGLAAIQRENGKTKELDWRECPFVPENGYGEVTVSPDFSGVCIEVHE